MTVTNKDNDVKGKKLVAASLGSNTAITPLTAAQARPLAAEAAARWRAVGADPRNVAFMETHAAEIQARQEALEAALGPIHPVE